MAKSSWTPFPYPNKAFDYAGDRLQAAWAQLHAGDQEPFPDERHLARLLETQPRLGKDRSKLAVRLQEAWRAFHRGDFEAAYTAGVALGPLGASVAIKAGGIHASHLLTNHKDKTARFAALIELAEQAVAELPTEANSHYRLAFALGRYGQCISIPQALAQGIAGKLRAALEETLRLAPRHAEAYTALGLYHAEIVAKVGGLLAKLTYGASAAEAEQRLQQARKLTPKAPIVWIEYGNAQLLLRGAAGQSEAAAAYAKAAQLQPRDAMEALDVAWARARLA